MIVNQSYKINADRKWNIALLAIFSLALVLRFIYFSQSSDNPLLYMPILDEAYYVNMGIKIANGFWLGEDGPFFMDPLYGYLLGIIFWIFGDNLTTIRVLQIILDSFNVVIIYAIGKKVCSRNAGVLSALFYAIYKVAFFYTLLVLKTTFTTFFILLFMLLLFKTINGKRGVYWYLMGLFAALIVYLRANLILMAPFAIFFYWLFNRDNWRETIKNSIILFAGLATILSVGFLRNFYVGGEFIAFNTQTGRLFYSSNNPENLTGRYNVPSFSRPNPEHSETDFHREAEQRLGKALNVKEVSKYWTRETIKFLLANPKLIPVLLYHKLKGTIGNCEIPNNHSFYVSSNFSSLSGWPLPNFTFALAFGIPGLIMGMIKRREVTWLYIPILTILITIILFYTSSRLRMPVVPFLLIGAGICFSMVAGWIRQKKPKKIITLLAVIISLVAISLSVPCPGKSGTEEFYLAKAYWKQNDLPRARTIALKGAAMFPLQDRFRVLLGMISFSENKLAEAIRYNSDAIKMDPGNSDAYNNMALVYLTLEKPEKALAYIKKAMMFQNNPEYIFTLAQAYEKMGDISSAIMNYERYLKESKPLSPMRGEVIIRLTDLKKK